MFISAKPGLVVSVTEALWFLQRSKWREIQRPVVPPCGVEQRFSFYVQVSMNYEVLCCSIGWGVWSGCNPASHKICKNNAITMTVYKVPQVNILVKVRKKKNSISWRCFFFLSFLFVTF